MEAELNDYIETFSLRAPEQNGFRQAFSIVDHIFRLRWLIDQTKACKKKLFFCFVNYLKAIDIVPKEQLFYRLKSLEILDDMIWIIYEQVFRCVRCQCGLSNCFTKIRLSPMADSFWNLH